MEAEQNHREMRGLKAIIQDIKNLAGGVTAQWTKLRN